MLRIQLLSLVTLLLSGPLVQAQNANTIFLAEGKIEFERKVNLYAQLDDDNAWTDLNKKSMPQFKMSYFDLLFNHNKTLYRPGRENTDNNKLWQEPAGDQYGVFRPGK